MPPSLSSGAGLVRKGQTNPSGQTLLGPLVQPLCLHIPQRPSCSGPANGDASTSVAPQACSWLAATGRWAGRKGTGSLPFAHPQATGLPSVAPWPDNPEARSLMGETSWPNLLLVPRSAQPEPACCWDSGMGPQGRSSCGLTLSGTAADGHGLQSDRFGRKVPGDGSAAAGRECFMRCSQQRRLPAWFSPTAAAGEAATRATSASC